MTREDKIVLDKVRPISHSSMMGNVQVAVTWKTECQTLTNNYEMAYSRLRNTEKLKRLLRQWEKITSGLSLPTLKKDQYIRKVQETENESQSIWYLPHFLVFPAVCCLERSTTKTSAKFQGTSLNEILPGLRLQNNLFHAPLRFRRFPVAIYCEGMLLTDTHSASIPSKV